MVISGLSRQALVEWFTRLPGSRLLASELERFDAILPDLFGYHLLQIGELGARDVTRASRILHREVLLLGDRTNRDGGGVQATAYALPIKSDSVDVVVLPHVLEFEPRAHEALREVQRILVPQGNVVISGFNPWSWFGMWRLAAHRGGMGVVPWAGNFLTLNRIKDWLSLLGFDVQQVDTFFHRPPISSERLLQRLSFMEAFGERCGGRLGGAYVLVAKNQVSALTPIRPKWSAQPRLVSVGLAEPTARVARTSEPTRR